MLDLATYLAGTSLTHVFSKTQSRKLVKWMLCINMIVIAWIAHIGIGLENFHDNQHQKSGYNLLIERTQYPISQPVFGHGHLLDGGCPADPTCEACAVFSMNYYVHCLLVFCGRFL